MSTDRDVTTRIVRSWLHEDAHEDADRILNLVLDQIDTTPQRSAPWLARRFSIMNTNLARLGIAAAVVAIAVLGYNLLPGLGIVGPGATPSASPVLLARGDFVEHDFGHIEFEAIREGSSVTGHMTFAEREDGFGPITVDLRCTLATDDGLVMIGGYVTVGSQNGEPGTPAWVALQRGSPDLASVNYGSPINLPATHTTDCLAYLDGWLQWYRAGGYTIPLHVLDGGVEFGP